MERSAAQEEVLDRAYSLSPTEFEVLCKVVLGESLPFVQLSVTPQSHDEGIDIAGRLNHDWIAADFGIQAKRRSTNGSVGIDRIHRFAGALLANQYQVGSLMTTGTFSKPAEKAAERLPVKLVSGHDLASAMVEGEIGVRSSNEKRFHIVGGFWKKLAETDEKIDSSEIPLSPNFERMRAVLEAMRETNGTAQQIRRSVESNEQYDIQLSSRHTYINANSATALGWARKEPPVESGNVKRWGLTEVGAEYLSTEMDSPTERERRAEAIRGVEIIELLLRRFQEKHELAADEIDAIVEDETTLTGESIDRRGSTVRTWLTQLPEISVNDSTNGKIYRYTST